MKFLLILIFLVVGNASVAAQTGRCQPRDIRFSKGQSSIILRKQLEPCNHLIYRFRAKSGQKMHVILRPEINDVVFLIQGTKYIPALGSFVLNGIHRNGVTEWDGDLPNDDVYEIWIQRPDVSNSRQKRTLPFKLFVEIK